MTDSAKVPTRICVFCSTTSGRSPAHLAAARSLAEVMHSRGISLVYGGGTTGMMGELAKTLVGLSGPQAVQGYIPKAIISIERPEDKPSDAGIRKTELKSGWLRKLLGSQQTNNENHAGMKGKAESALLSEEVYGRAIATNDMHERKMMMANDVATGGPGSGFIGLSGGFGTMDELMEMATWHGYGVHRRGTCLYNVEGYWDGIMTWMENAIDAEFIRAEGRKILVSRQSAEECIDWLKNYQAD